MAIERTLAILKPDAIGKKVIGAIIHHYEQNGLEVIAMRMHRLTVEEARQFYYVHHERPFYHDLIDFMVSGPVVILVLQGENGIQVHRQLIGDTNPKKAKPGTIRARFADSIDANIVHGSDAVETASEEVAFFFKPEEIFSE
jgi:nucleoside-diphosphate kinase